MEGGFRAAVHGSDPADPVDPLRVPKWALVRGCVQCLLLTQEDMSSVDTEDIFATEGMVLRNNILIKSISDES